MANNSISDELKNTRSISSTFYECDVGHKGFLSREDVKIAVVSLFGYKPSKQETDTIMNRTSASTPYKPGLTLQAFTEAMKSKMLAEDEDDIIRQTFLAFDSQCRSFLTVDDLKKVISKVAPHLPAHAVEAAFREIDRDGDGRVSFRDFEFMMKYNQDGLSV